MKHVALSTTAVVPRGIGLELSVVMAMAFIAHPGTLAVLLFLAVFFARLIRVYRS